MLSGSTLRKRGSPTTLILGPKARLRKLRQRRAPVGRDGVKEKEVGSRFKIAFQAFCAVCCAVARALSAVFSWHLATQGIVGITTATDNALG
jgi:hypothetical protein